MKFSPFAKPSIIQRIGGYIQNPSMIWYDFIKKARILNYNFLNFIDPPPKQKKHELTKDYFERVHPRFGVRFYWMMLHISQHFDFVSAMEYINENYKNTVIEKNLKELIIEVNKIDQDNIERYKRHRMRLQLLKQEENN